jgi:LacI family transcriptional regulator
LALGIKEPVEMITLEDVAAAAGVSVSTASRALSGSSRISRQTILKVQGAAEQLRYRPNSLARGLKTNNSRLIGLVVHNIFNATYQRVAQVIQRRLAASNYQVILGISNDDQSQEALHLETLLDHRIDGLIIVPTGRNFRLLSQMASHGVPIVTAIRRHAQDSFESVLQADSEGAYRGTRHLLELGHRRIGIIVGLEETTSGRERLAGYNRALEEFGVTPQSSLIFSGGYRIETGVAGCEALLAARPDISALFCANHEASLGVLKVLSDRNVQVPSQLSLLCYEDSPWLNWRRPSITVVDNDPDAIGETCVDLLLRAMATQIHADGPKTGREVRIGARLLVRESTQSITPPQKGAPPTAGAISKANSPRSK